MTPWPNLWEWGDWLRGLHLKTKIPFFCASWHYCWLRCFWAAWGRIFLQDHRDSSLPRQRRQSCLHVEKDLTGWTTSLLKTALEVDCSFMKIGDILDGHRVFLFHAASPCTLNDTWGMFVLNNVELQLVKHSSNMASTRGKPSSLSASFSAWCIVGSLFAFVLDAHPFATEEDPGSFCVILDVVVEWNYSVLLPILLGGEDSQTFFQQPASKKTQVVFCINEQAPMIVVWSLAFHQDKSAQFRIMSIFSKQSWLCLRPLNGLCPFNALGFSGWPWSKRAKSKHDLLNCLEFNKKHIILFSIPPPCTKLVAFNDSINDLVDQSQHGTMTGFIRNRAEWPINS